MVKEWMPAIGEETSTPDDADSLLKDKVSDRQRRRIERQEEEDEAAHEAKMAELRKRTATSAAVAEKAEDKVEDKSGFKIHGGINLGEINYQQMLQEQVAERDRLREQAESAASHQQQVSDELREKLHASEIEVLKTSFNAQMQLLAKAIEQGASKGNFAEQLNAAREVAKDLGFQQVTPNGGDATLQIELKRLEFEQNKAIREMNRADKAEQRKWDLELRRLDDEREAAKAKLAQDKERLEMLKQVPKVIGEAVGQALLSGNAGAASEASTPARSQPKNNQRYELEVPMGQGGVTHCPECNEEVGVGPTAKMAVCANCNTKVSIRRTQPASETETPPSSTEDDEEEDSRR